MTNNPETGRKETSPEPIERPERKSNEAVGVRMGEFDNGRINERVEVSRSLVDATNDEGIPEAVHIHKPRRRMAH